MNDAVRCRSARGVGWFVVVLALVGSGLFGPVASAGAGTAPHAATPSAAPLPTPRPAAVDASGDVSVFPAPGTPDVSPTTGITFRGRAAAPLQKIGVTGSRSGAHPGHFQPAPDASGTTFIPDTGFDPGEHVVVDTGLALRGAVGGHFEYDVARPAPVKAKPFAAPKAPKGKPPDDSMHFQSRPDLQPPKLIVTTHKEGAAPGDVFLTPSGGNVQHGPLIVDDDGQPVWFRPLGATHAYNFQVQQYQGNPVLTWFEGNVAAPGYGIGSYVIADEHYREIARVHAANGYAGDLHDFVITPAGTALFTVYNPVLADASSVGGSRNRAVFDGVVQEIDIATGALRFEWHSLGSIALDESYERVPKQQAFIYDYVHPNSVSLDLDGNLLVSGRHTFAVYKLDRLTGTLDWRLGGKKNNFTSGHGTATAWQHHVERHADGTLTIFDNGASGDTATHKFSRGMVVEVDEQSMTETLKSAYEPPERISAQSQGSFELLANGDYFAGWGDRPEYTEFRPDGTVVVDTRFPEGPARTVNSYRAFRYTWNGQPADPPAAAAVRKGANVTVYASWNGATAVATWTVLAGPDLQHLGAVGSAPRAGFETAVPVVTNQPLLAVRASDAAGSVLGTSPAVTPRA